MIKEEMLSILEAEGWYIFKDEVEDHVGLLEVNSTLLQVIPVIRKRSDHFRVSLMPSLSTVEFSRAVDDIFGRKESYSPIVVSNLMPEKIASPSAADIVRLSVDTISWGEEQDIEDGLRKYRELPTSSKGAMPLRHLAALAIHGNSEQLTFYRDRLLGGDRLGFVPFITLPMLEKALSISQKYSE